MTFPTNGALKKVIATVAAGVISALIIFIVTQGIFNQVQINTNRITAVEVEIKTLKDQLQQNRNENREEHKSISDKLDIIAREVRK